MSRIVHMCLDIRGALRWNRRQLRGMFVDTDTGRKTTADQSREILMDHLSKGRRVLPMDPDCRGFSYDTGCPGHETQ